MNPYTLTEIKDAIREHTGLVYRADLADLLKAGEENLRLNKELDASVVEVVRLNSEIESLRADAKRLDVAAANYAGADFEYGFPGTTARSVLLIDLPDGVRVNSDLRDTLDRFPAPAV
jgi:hypothetical protein